MSTNTVATSAGDRDAARLEVDEQIRSLKTTRNALAPISQLPAELLLHIFKLVGNAGGGIHDWMLSGRPQPSRLDPVGWKELMKISQTCHQWRSLAMGCPSLWSRISFKNQLIMGNLLSRADSSPLSIEIDSIAALQNISQVGLRFDTDRIRALHLTLSERSLSRAVDLIRGANGDHLRSLSFNDPSYSDAFQQFVVPKRVMSWHMPHLQHLQLVNCTIRWDLLQQCVWNQLLSVVLCRPSTLPSRKQFFDLLAQNPKLEMLYVERALPLLPSSDIVHPMELSGLSSLTVKDSTLQQCLDFQTNISYPINTTQLYLRPLDSGIADISLIKALVSACGDSTNTPRRHCLLLEASPPSPSPPDLILSPAPCKYDHQKYEPGECDPFTKIMLYQERAKTSSWTDLFSFPGLDNLIINSRTRVTHDADEWFRFFKRHEKITELRIDTSPASPIFSALSTPSDRDHVYGMPNQNDKPSSAGYRRPCLPNLVSLTWAGHDDHYIEDLDLLRKYLSLRRGCGLKIQQLRLVECPLTTQEEDELLKKEVGQVIWDGARRAAFVPSYNMAYRA